MSPPVTRNPVAAQLYTVRDRLQDVGQLSDTLGRLREIGYGAVEVAGLGQRAAERFGDQLRQAGLVACAAHVALERLTGDLSAVAEQCRAWGCQYVVVPSLPADYVSGAGFMRFAGEAAEIARELRPLGLRLAYHNHDFELERWEGLTGLEELFASTAPDVLTAELDVYWLQAAGASPSAWIRRLRGRAALVHLKDMAIVARRAVQAEVGEGNLDWPDILSACRDSGTEWLIVEQDECERDPIDSLAISYANLVKLGGAS